MSEQRLIDANVATKEVNDLSSGVLSEWDTMGVLCLLDRQPTINAVPVVHGKWEHSREANGFALVKCSACGTERYAISNVVAKGKCCPDCGAYMREDK